MLQMFAQTEAGLPHPGTSDCFGQGGLIQDLGAFQCALWMLVVNY